MSYGIFRPASRWTAIGYLFLCALLIAAVGCQNAKKKGKAGAEKAGVEKAGAEKAGAEKAEKKTVCGEYADKLCKETDEQSPLCQSVKAAVEIMAPSACKAGIADMAISKKLIGDTRKKCGELMDKLCADLGPKSESCTMVRAQTEKFSPQRCESLMQNYDRVLDQIKKQEEAKKPLTPEKQAELVAPPAPSFGPVDSKVVMVEFSDFQCPYCTRAAAAAKQIKEKYGKQVRFVFRQFPLSFHKDANLAAQAALAADAQGKFWQYHDMLFENQRKLDRPVLEKIAKDIGLNVAQFKKALDDKTFAKAVENDIALGNKVAVSGTPTMFFNGERVPNPTDFAEISKRIEAALKTGG